MKKLELPLFSSYIIVLTWFFYIDYFPNSQLAHIVPKTIVLVILIVLLALGLFVPNFRNPKSLIGRKKNLIFQIVIFGYLLILMIILALLGGYSQSGLYIGNPFILFLFFYAYSLIFYKWRKFKKEEAVESKKS
jgi:hypothetical protein